MDTKARRPDASALVHGAAWRAASLASRVAFLALVVPRTIPGEYGLFFSYSSIGLLLSRVMSFGAIDHLPTWVKGDRARMLRAARDFAPLSALATAATAVAVASQGLLVSALALALSMASGLMLAGAIRSVGPAWFERWLNLHPLLLLGIALLLGEGVAAKELLICQSVAILISQLILLRFVSTSELALRAPDLRAWLRRVKAMLRGGHSRMVSDALMIGCIRGVAIGPVLFGVGAVSDSMALALALGEAGWTVGMILVHRNFSYYCSSGPDVRHSARSATMLLVAMAAAGVVGIGLALAIGSSPIIQRMELPSLLAAFALFAGISALSEFRYFDVASGKPLLVWVFGQTAFLALAVSSPYVLGELGSVSLLAWLTVVGSVSLIARRWQSNLHL